MRRPSHEWWRGTRPAACGRAPVFPAAVTSASGGCRTAAILRVVKGIHVAPSILAADFGRLGEVIAEAQAGGADLIHVDVMDGHFVPNISFGPGVVAAVRPHAKKLFFDVHLMCGKPEILLEPFARAGANQITVHVELGEKVPQLLWKIKSLGKKVGLAVNPPTAIAEAQPYLDKIDLLLVMTVNPGFGGQRFIPECLTKV